MSHELAEGVELESVWWDEGSIVVGKGGCVSMTVREQYGQMSMVPWAEVVFESGTRSFYNLALSEGVTVHEGLSTDGS